MGYAAKRRQRVRRHAAKAGFQAKVTAKRSGYAHTACAVGAHAQRAHACGHGSSRTTARATGRFANVPRVARDARARRVGLALAAKLRGGGFAQYHSARLFKPRSHRRVDIPSLVGIYRVAAAQCGHASGQDEVFDGRGHAFKRTHGCACCSSTVTVCLPRGLAARSSLC